MAAGPRSHLRGVSAILSPMDSLVPISTTALVSVRPFSVRARAGQRHCSFAVGRKWEGRPEGRPSDAVVDLPCGTSVTAFNLQRRISLVKNEGSRTVRFSSISTDAMSSSATASAAPISNPWPFAKRVDEEKKGVSAGGALAPYGALGGKVHDASALVGDGSEACTHSAPRNDCAKLSVHVRAI